MLREPSTPGAGRHPYKLYGRQNSGSFAIQAALEQIGASYEQVWIPNDAGAILEFHRVNPTGKVPALALPDGTVMFESAAILVHLALEHPQARLAPDPGTSQHAIFLQWMTFLSANVYEAVLRMYYAPRYSTRGEADAAAIKEQATRDFLQYLALVGGSLSPYVLGGQYSIADVYLYMLASWFPAGMVELEKRMPVFAEHARLLSQQPGLVKAKADHAM